MFPEVQLFGKGSRKRTCTCHDRIFCWPKLADEGHSQTDLVSLQIGFRGSRCAESPGIGLLMLFTHHRWRTNTCKPLGGISSMASLHMEVQKRRLIETSLPHMVSFHDLFQKTKDFRKHHSHGTLQANSLRLVDHTVPCRHF